MQQEAEVLQTQIHHRKSELLAVQKKSDNQKKLFERQTEELLKQQKAELDKQRQEFDVELEIKQKQLTALESDIDTAKGILGQLRDQITSQTTVLEQSDKDLKIAQATLRETNQAIDNQNRELEKLQVDKTHLDESIINADETLQRVFGEINNLKPQKKELEDKIVALNTAWAEEKAKKERSIAILDGKLLSLTQNIEQTEKQEEQTRNDMAVWAKKLEAREQNLRIREAKATQDEDKIVRNSNLLNL